MSRLSLTLFAFLLLLGGCDRAAPDAAQEQGALPADKAALAGVIDRSHAGELMPVVGVRDAAGQELNLGALQGRPVLLNLWATWCAPCKKELPLLDDLAEERAGELRVVTVSQDQRNLEQVSVYLAERKLANLPAWLDPESKLLGHFNTGLPFTVLYDSSGREVWRVTGDYDWSSAEAAGAIDEALR